MIKKITKKQLLEDLTIVIPTIGEDTLFRTLKSIYNSLYVPREVLISIPELMCNKNICNLKKKYKSVRLLKTSKAGQVLQRIEGFKKVSTELVLQLDSDIELKPNSIKMLYDSIKRKGPKASVGVIFIPEGVDANSYKSPKEDSNFNIRSLYYLLIDGTTKKRPGKIYKSGAVEQFTSNDGAKELFEVEWFPGGCSIHWVKNLIIKNYFPFKGVAYCEDVLHSHEIHKKGIKLWVNSKIILNHKISSYTNLKINSFFNYFIKDFRARRLVVERMNLSYVRMVIFYLIILFNYFINLFLVKLIQNKKNYKI